MQVCYPADRCALPSTVTEPVFVVLGRRVGSNVIALLKDAAETVVTRCYGASPIRLPIVCGQSPNSAATS
jgi:hypothetical protein